MTRLNRAMTSVYISAMILSGISQASSTVSLASVLDPRLPQQALSSMISGLNAAGIEAALGNGVGDIPKPLPTSYSQTSAGRTPPVLSLDGLNKLKRTALAAPEQTTISANIAKLLELGDQILPAKALKGPDGKQIISFCLNSPTSDDIVFFVKEPGITYIYLSDSTRYVRRAGILDANGLHKVSETDLHTAEESFQTQSLEAWKKITEGITLNASNG